MKNRNAYMREYYQRPEPKVRRQKQRKERRLRRKLEAMAKYGSKCNKCGFSDHRALQFDHVNGNGREDLKKRYREEYYNFIIADTTGRFQLLCANCNWIKRFEEDAK